MSRCKIFALGPLRIELEDKPVRTSRHKALALLVYLAMGGQKHRREALAALFWPEHEQAKAYAYLRRTLWEINSLLGEGWLESDREEVGLRPGADLWLDAADFNARLTSLKQHLHPKSETCPKCLLILREAADLYRGDFLAEFTLRDSAGFDDWQFFQAECLRREAADGLQKLVSALEREAAYEPAIEFAHRWLALDPLNEAAHRRLMQLFARQGQTNMALHQYQECTRLLQTELGVNPEPETVQLHDKIQAGRAGNRGQASRVAIPTLLASSPASWLDQVLSTPAGTAAVHNLPPQPTPFVGRADELRRIGELFYDPACWLLTLLGPGGIGKTRLAIQAALEHQETFPQGICLVPLATVKSAASIMPAIGKALQLDFRPDGPSPEQQVSDFLREKRLLLVLDSFEHLVKSADQLQRLHVQAEGVKLLVTSRHRLQLQGEWVLEVVGLHYPERLPTTLGELQTFSAVALFLQTARRAKANFQATKVDIPALARICQILEGMPLGLELAAAWVKALTCAEIASEIAHNLDFLQTTLQDLPERQRSLRAVFDHSWQLLTAREQRLFSRLSVFRGGFTRQAAEQVAGIDLRELVGLADKSLVRRTPQGRFEMHELLRQSGTEKLTERPADRAETCDRHSHYYCGHLERWGAMLKGPEQQEALIELEADLGNVHAAWEWAAERRQVGWLAEAMDGLCVFNLRRLRYAEGQAASQEAARALDGLAGALPQRARAKLLAWQGAFYLNVERLDDAGRCLQSSQTLLDDPNLDPGEARSERAFLLLIQSVWTYLLGQTERAIHGFNQSLDLYREAGDQSSLSVIFFWKLLINAGVYSANVWNLFERDLAAKRAAGNAFEAACLLQTMGVIAGYHAADGENAEHLLRESCELLRDQQDSISQAMLLNSLDTLLTIQGQFKELLSLRQRKLAVARDLGDRRMIGYAQAEVGETLYHLGDYAEAETQTRKGLDFLRGKNPYEHALWQQHLGNVWLAKGQVQEAGEAYQASLAFFRAVGEKGWGGTTLAGLSHVEHVLGERTAAWAYALEALQFLLEIRMFAFFIPRVLAVVALLFSDAGEKAQAARLLGVIQRYPFWANSCWFGDLYLRPIQTAAGLSTEEMPLDQELGQMQSLWDTAEAVEVTASRFALSLELE